MMVAEVLAETTALATDIKRECLSGSRRVTLSLFQNTNDGRSGT